MNSNVRAALSLLVAAAAAGILGALFSTDDALGGWLLYYVAILLLTPLAVLLGVCALIFLAIGVSNKSTQRDRSPDASFRDARSRVDQVRASQLDVDDEGRLL